MDLLLAAAAAVVAVGAWTAWESVMVSRLAHDTRSLRRRNAAVAGAHRLTVVGQLGLLALAVVLAGLVQVPLWWNAAAVAPPVVGAVVTVLLVALAAVAAWWTARRGFRPQDRRALLAVAVTALSTEVLLRGLGLGLLDAAGWSVTGAVLATSVATGLLQAGRAGAGNRAFAFVLATLLGFALGLVVLLTGSVAAAAAIHVTVAVLGLGRTFPARGHAPGCLCGQDHGTATSTTAPTATGATGATGATTTAAPAGGGSAQAGPHAATRHAPGAADAHASCGTTCDHAGSPACAVCPLSSARV